MSGDQPRSGLRNPAGAVRGAGAGALAAMAVVLLLAVVPFVKLRAPGWVIAAVLVLATAAIVLCGLLRRPWAWYAALAVPAGLLVAGLAQPALAVLGGLFALVWGYLLHVRRTVLGGRGSSGAAPNG